MSIASRRRAEDQIGRRQNLGPVKRAPEWVSFLDKEQKKDVLARVDLKQVTQVIFLILCLGGCIYQCQDLLNLFFEYPYTVFIKETPADKLYLPGLTLCNSNSFRLSKLKNQSQTFAATWAEMEKKVNGSKTDPKKLLAIEWKKQALIDATLKVAKDKVVSELITLGPQFKQFVDVKFFRCSSDLTNNPCIDMAKPLVTMQEIGNCFTLFHGSKRTGDGVNSIAVDPGYCQSPIRNENRNDSKDSVKQEVSALPIQPNEVVRMRVDFSPEEYTVIDDPVYGAITIHDPTECPNMRMRKYRIYPGMYYEYFIKKVVTTRLTSPYPPNCTDYNVMYKANYLLPKDKFVAHPYLNSPLSRDDCIVGCLANKTLELCGCWPQELPFLDGYPNFKINGYKGVNNLNQIKLCDWGKVAKSKPKKSTQQDAFDQCFGSHEAQCNKDCPKDCTITRYTVSVQSFQWPAEKRIALSGNKKDNLTALRKCCATISIRYWTSDKTEVNQTEKFQPVEFVSYVGGLVSMWLGFSFFGFYDQLHGWWCYWKKKWVSWKQTKEKEEGRVIVNKQDIPFHPKYRHICYERRLLQQLNAKHL